MEVIGFFEVHKCLIQCPYYNYLYSSVQSLKTGQNWKIQDSFKIIPGHAEWFVQFLLWVQCDSNLRQMISAPVSRIFLIKFVAQFRE